MRTLVVGCNHRSAAVQRREQIAFDAEAVPCALERFKQAFPEAEVVLISTCNRVEFHVARPLQGRPRIDEIIKFVTEFHGVETADFAEVFYAYEGLESVRHLFRVVCSLDSMVLGESEIVRQTRSAFEIARSCGTVGKTLNNLFQRALAVAKEVRTSTSIATGRLSVGSTAVDFARQIFSHFDDKTVLMVGAGEMGELTLIHLLGTGPRRLWVANRTDEHAVELARRLAQKHPIPVEPVAYADWINRLADADIVITCTSAREPILTPELFAPIPARRKYRPLLVIDIAVPRDIDSGLSQYDCVYLYNIDDLQSVTEANLVHRTEAIAYCQEMIEAAVIEFAEREPQADIGHLITSLQQRFREVGRSELERILPKLESTSPHDRELIEQMLHRVTQKLMHGPVELLNARPANPAIEVYADALRALFDLETEEPKED